LPATLLMDTTTRIHLACGDCAADALRLALDENQKVFVLRDDLAVGPLANIDENPPTKRIAYWDSILESGESIYEKAVEETEIYLSLSKSDLPLTAWVGSDSAEQIMLRRIAWRIRNSDTQLAVVFLNGEDLRGNEKTSTSLISYDRLTQRSKTARILTINEIESYARDWESLKNSDSEVRLWKNGKFELCSSDIFDSTILEEANLGLQNATELIQKVMHRVEGIFITDSFLFSRLRALARDEAIEISSYGLDLTYRSLPQVSVRRLER